jgi:hypothetical protein
MTMTPEEREAWRKSAMYALQSANTHIQASGRITNHLLDALDAAEARAEQVERERDVLAQVLGLVKHCPPRPHRGTCGLPIIKGRRIRNSRACKACWLAWARQEAVKRGEEK